MTTSVEIRAAIKRLHAEKDAAYSNAWKRRGELISIIANIARKVDRLEQVAAGGPITRDESLVDTAIDLLVYGLKYQTYLADTDTDVAARLFGAARPPFSDGRGGFEALFDALDLSALDMQARVPSAADASAAVVAAFNDLESCFANALAPAPAGERLERAVRLTDATTQLVAAVWRETPTPCGEFLKTWGGERPSEG